MSRTPPLWSVGVIVPAQNEEATIARCIQSILRAGEASARCADLWIIVVADHCIDDTVWLAQLELADRGAVLECKAGSPGNARRFGAAAVLQHFRLRDRRRLWLANTDADTLVPADWIETHLQHADRDAGAVAGIVELDAEGLRPDVDLLYQSTYKVAADGSHAHVHGANLGVRADAYLDVGGWRNLTVAEDHCLWGRLRQRGWRLQSPAASVVQTSGRLHGRAIGGFADTLRRELRTGK